MILQLVSALKIVINSMPAHSGGESITISQFLRSSVFHTVVKVIQLPMMKSAHSCQKREGKNAKSDGQLGPKKKKVATIFRSGARARSMGNRKWAGASSAHSPLSPENFGEALGAIAKEGSEKKKIDPPNFFCQKNVPAAAQCSRLVTHVNTLWPLRCLSARIGRDAEGSSRYGRRWKPLPFSTFYTHTPNTNLN